MNVSLAWIDHGMKYLVPFLVFFVVLGIGFLVRRLALKRLAVLSARTISTMDDVFVAVVTGPSVLWCVMLAVYTGLSSSPLPDDIVRFCGKGLGVLGMVSVMLVAANISGHLVSRFSRHIETAFPVTSLTRNLARTIIFSVGILIILNSLGVSIAPILATLGVGGLAVALGLQDTLSNLFSGLHIIIAKQIKVGDYVKMDSGEEGYVTDITWRTTKIKMLPNNEILVPNERLTKAIVTNYYLPDREMAVLVNVGVHYNSDLNKVEQVTCEVAKDVMKTVQGGVPAFDPFIRYHTFGDFSIDFTVILRAREFVDQYLIKHEFVKKLHVRYAREGIVIPYPIRAINSQQEKVA